MQPRSTRVGADKGLPTSNANTKSLLGIPLGVTRLPDVGGLASIAHRMCDGTCAISQKQYGALTTTAAQVFIRFHPRLLVRAKEWESKGQDSSMLLRGSELRETEEWQAQAAQKEPKPTSLQSEYILASCRAASRRYRATIGVMGLAAVFFVVLAAISLWQWSEARSNAQEAELPATLVWSTMWRSVRTPN